MRGDWGAPTQGVSSGNGLTSPYQGEYTKVGYADE
ncbi:MAG: hypothetical protein ACI8PT_002787 [Gammaproteobacteria bacterium]|jgi:hypothetical protein